MGVLKLEHPVAVYKTYGTKSVHFLRAIECLGLMNVGSTIRAMGPGFVSNLKMGPMECLI
jgi:hypothetical protein